MWSWLSLFLFFSVGAFALAPVNDQLCQKGERNFDLSSELTGCDFTQGATKTCYAFGSINVIDHALRRANPKITIPMSRAAGLAIQMLNASDLELQERLKQAKSSGSFLAGGYPNETIKAILNYGKFIPNLSVPGSLNPQSPGNRSADQIKYLDGLFMTYKPESGKPLSLPYQKGRSYTKQEIRQLMDNQVKEKLRADGEALRAQAKNFLDLNFAIRGEQALKNKALTQDTLNQIALAEELLPTLHVKEVVSAKTPGYFTRFDSNLKSLLWAYEKRERPAKALLMSCFEDSERLRADLMKFLCAGVTLTVTMEMAGVEMQSISSKKWEPSGASKHAMALTGFETMGGKKYFTFTDSSDGSKKARVPVDEACRFESYLAVLGPKDPEYHETKSYRMNEPEKNISEGPPPSSLPVNHSDQNFVGE